VWFSILILVRSVKGCSAFQAVWAHENPLKTSQSYLVLWASLDFILWHCNSLSSL